MKYFAYLSELFWQWEQNKISDVVCEWGGWGAMVSTTYCTVHLDYPILHRHLWIPVPGGTNVTACPQNNREDNIIFPNPMMTENFCWPKLHFYNPEKRTRKKQGMWK